jgi:carboxymethylenebutenolidase
MLPFSGRSSTADDIMDCDVHCSTKPARIKFDFRGGSASIGASMGTKIAFKRPDGKDGSGYLAKAGRANAPGLVVIQEWWGLQDQIKGICDRFARAGYEALAPDLYAGTIVPYHDTDAANREMSSLNFLEATDQLVRGAAQYLKLTGVKVGLTGFCLGGAVTILGAVRVPEFSAAVCFYGIPPASAANPADIRVPLQAHFANDDDWCTPAAVDSFEAALKGAGKSAEIFRYDAKHGFMNEQRPDAHQRQAAELAWKRTLEFWGMHL